MAIIIGSLIVLSLLFSIFRCCCLGVECCCGIFACCNACCPSPRRTKTKYVEAPQQPAPQYAYLPQAPMGYFPPAGVATATFDAPSGQPKKAANIRADALPAMPSWNTAATRRIEYEEEEAEDAPLTRPVNQSLRPVSPLPGGPYGSQDVPMTRLDPRRPTANAGRINPPPVSPAPYMGNGGGISAYSSAPQQNGYHGQYADHGNAYGNNYPQGAQSQFQGGDLGSEYLRNEPQYASHHEQTGYSYGQPPQQYPRSEPMGSNMPHHNPVVRTPQELYNPEDVSTFASQGHQAYGSYASRMHNISPPQELDTTYSQPLSPQGYNNYRSHAVNPTNLQEIGGEGQDWGTRDPSVARKPIHGSWREV